MSIGKKWVLGLVLVGSIIGGALGGGVLGSSAGSAATGTPTVSSVATLTTAPSGGWVENTSPAHEAGESAARKAAEASGQGGPGAGGKFVPNTDPAHEAGESADRAAQEDAGQFPTVP
jgi:hypothetical protein